MIEATSKVSLNSPLPLAGEGGAQPVRAGRVRECIKIPLVSPPPSPYPLPPMGGEGKRVCHVAYAKPLRHTIFPQNGSYSQMAGISSLLQHADHVQPRDTAHWCHDAVHMSQFWDILGQTSICSSTFRNLLYLTTKTAESGAPSASLYEKLQSMLLSVNLQISQLFKNFSELYFMHIHTYEWCVHTIEFNAECVMSKNKNDSTICFIKQPLAFT